MRRRGFGLRGCGLLASLHLLRLHGMPLFELLRLLLMLLLDLLLLGFARVALAQLLVFVVLLLRQFLVVLVLFGGQSVLLLLIFLVGFDVTGVGRRGRMGCHVARVRGRGCARRDWRPV